MALSETIAALRAVFPWLPTEVLKQLAAGYVETGDAEGALNEFRDSDTYERYFPGNKREDGTLRYDEAGYFTYTERARIALQGIGVNADLFSDQIVGALAGDVSIGQLERNIDLVYDNIIDRAPELLDFYARSYGIAPTVEALVASVLDPTGVGQQALEGQITAAVIGGEAASRGFGISLDLANTIRQAGVGAEQASGFFDQASENVPILNVLARRHADPNDPFNIDDFVSATLLSDPVERQRMRRLVAQERSSFSQGSFARDRDTGAQSGLLGA